MSFFIYLFISFKDQSEVRAKQLLKIILDHILFVITRLMEKILVLVSYFHRYLLIDSKSSQYYFAKILFSYSISNYFLLHFSDQYYLYIQLLNDFFSLVYYLLILHFNSLLCYQLINLILYFLSYFMEIKYFFTILLIDLQNYS